MPVLLVSACDLIGALPCPTGPLSEADLPCTCGNALVESLDCGALSCEAGGLVVGPGTDTGDCTSTTTFTDTGSTDRRPPTGTFP